VASLVINLGITLGKEVNLNYLVDNVKLTFADALAGPLAVRSPCDQAHMDNAAPAPPTATTSLNGGREDGLPPQLLKARLIMTLDNLILVQKVTCE